MDSPSCACTDAHKSQHHSDVYYRKNNGIVPAFDIQSGIEYQTFNSDLEARKKKKKLPRAIYLLTFFSALGGFLFGYDTGVVSGAMILIRDDFQLTTIWHESIVSATIAAAWLFSLIAAPSADRFGRKFVILTGSVVFAIGAMLMAFSPGDEIGLLCGRVVVGIGIGLASMCVPMYLSEMSPVEIRGRLTVTSTIFITGGQFVAAVICGALSEAKNGWRWMLGLGAVPAIIQFVGFLFMPESPRWLAAQERYYSASIITMAGVSDQSKAIWLAAVTAMFNFVFTFVGLYFVDRIGRRPLTLGSIGGVVLALFLLALSFHLSYLKSDDVTSTYGTKCDVYKSCSECTHDIDCGFCFYGTDSAIENSSCLPADESTYNEVGVVGPCSVTEDIDSGILTYAYDWCPSEYALMSILGLCLYLFFFAPGMGPMPWTINSEIYPSWARATCTGTATSVNWASNLLVSLTFLSLTEALYVHGTFYLFMIVASIGFITFLFILPETKGLSLERTQELFSQPLCSHRNCKN